MKNVGTIIYQDYISAKKIATINTFEKFADYTVNSGVYIVSATVEALQNDASVKTLSWISITNSESDPSTGFRNAISFPGGTRYPSAYFERIIVVNKTENIRFYIMCSEILSFNMLPLIFRIK